MVRAGPAVPRRHRRLALASRSATAVTQWARAAAAVTRWRSLKVAVFGYAMNGMGDIRVDEHSLLRTLGPQIDALAPGALHRAAEAVPDEDVRSLIAFEDERFEVDPRLSDAERESHARMQLGLEQLLERGGYRAYSTHFGAIAEDGRFTPSAARGRVEPDGQGLRLRRRGRSADRRADVRRDRPARRDAVHRDVRDGLRARRDADEPYGRGQLGDGPRPTARCG